MLETTGELYHKSCVATAKRVMDLVKTKKWDGVVICLTSRKGDVKTFWSSSEDAITAGALVIRAGLLRIGIQADSAKPWSEEDDSG